MKGYLQRMAAKAVRSSGGIHPMVGSIYAGAAFADRGIASAAIAATEEGLYVNSTEPVKAEDGVRVMKSDPRRIETLRPEERTEEKNAEARQTGLAPFRSLLNEVRSENAAARIHAGPTDAKESELPRRREFHYEPLLPPEARSVYVTAPAGPMKSDSVSRSAPAQRDPDRIEIHIGRIEVTAIPQEAPRPVAARARKSLDLGDYLKRRDGRTG